MFLNLDPFEAMAEETSRSILNKDFISTISPKNIKKTNSIEWPLVYPDRYKAILNLGSLRNKYSTGDASWGLAFGASFELLWEQTLFYGIGYQYNSVPKKDSLAGGTFHRILFQTGAIFQLDDFEKHHLLIHLRPGIAILGGKDANGSAFGIGTGFGYDYTINSDFIIAPEVIYNWYPAISDSPYWASGWQVGLRISFGR
jgi:hypothetical protein